MTKDNRISIKQYEQAADGKVSLEGIKWLRKWDVCVQCDSEEEAEALRARLSQPEQEPVAWTPVEIGVDVKSAGTHVVGMYVLMPDVVRHVFYSQFHPAPQREWVGLTDDEIEFYTEELGQGELGRGVLRAVIDFLKGKNT